MADAGVEQAGRRERRHERARRPDAARPEPAEQVDDHVGGADETRQTLPDGADSRTTTWFATVRPAGKFAFDVGVSPPSHG